MARFIDKSGPRPQPTKRPTFVGKLTVLPTKVGLFVGCGLGPLWMILGFAAPAHAQIPLDNLPNSPNLPPFRWFASTDPAHKNDDFFLLKPGETRRVPLAAGTLERLWSTAQFPDQIDLSLVAGKNRSQLLWSRGRAQRGLLADKTFTFFPSLQSDSLGKLDASAALVATNRAKEPSKWYFQAAVRPTSALSGESTGKESARRLFKIQLAPGETKLLDNFDSPGQLYEFSVAADVPGAQTFHDLSLVASFEGQNAVDAPLMSLAGQVEGDEFIENAVADFDGSRLVLRWPMPFQSAKISLRNDGQKPLGLDIGARIASLTTVPPFRFCATQIQKTPQNGRPVEILNLKGAGALVGMALALKPTAESRRRAFAYLEGNEIIVADGQKYEGTGTEDFFSSAWYFPDKPFSHPFEGLTQKLVTPQPPSVSAYRFLIPDAIPFRKSLHFDFEHGSGNNASDIGWKTALMWYQKPPLSLPVDAQNPAASAPQNSAPVAPNDTWKLWAAVGAGVVLGVLMRFFKRRRTS